MNNSNADNRPTATFPPRLFPSYGDLLAMLGIFFVAQVAVTLIGALVLLFSGRGMVDLEPVELGRFLALSSFVSCTATALMIWRYRRWRKAPKIHIALGLKGLNPLLIGWCYLLMMAVSVVLEPLYELLPSPNQNFGRGVWAFMAVVIIAPTLEEWICRGQIFGSLRSRYGVVRSLVLSALIFGVMHVQPVPVLNAFVLGLVLGFIYHKTNTLWSSIILHALYNGTAFALTVAGYGESSFRELFGAHESLYMLFYVVALLMMVCSLVAIWRMVHPKADTAATVTTPNAAHQPQIESELTAETKKNSTEE